MGPSPFAIILAACRRYLGGGWAFQQEEEHEEEEDNEEETALVLPESFNMSNKEVISSYHQFAEAWRLTVILVIVSCLVGMSLTTGLYAGSLFIEDR